MLEIGKSYLGNLKRVRSLVERAMSIKKGKLQEDLGILITPAKEDALCYECTGLVRGDGINVLILNHKGLIEREEYNFHRFHYAKN
jgi:hypothetical protein